MRALREYVENQFKKTPPSEAKKKMMQEILANMTEKAGDIMAEGKSEEDAVNKVIVEFGDMGELIASVTEKGISLKKKRALQLGYSIWGSLLISALITFINLYYSPDTIWLVYPIFAVIWWPLTMAYRWLVTEKEVR